MHNEDGDPTGIPRRAPRVLFAEAAARAGLIRLGESLDPAQVDYATEIVTLCARIVDRFAHPEHALDTVGDELRARLFEL
jgi:hypothetical protein